MYFLNKVHKYKVRSSSTSTKLQSTFAFFVKYKKYKSTTGQKYTSTKVHSKKLKYKYKSTKYIHFFVKYNSTKVQKVQNKKYKYKYKSTKYNFFLKSTSTKYKVHLFLGHVPNSD